MAPSRALHPCRGVCLVQKQPKAMVSVDELPRKFAFICQHQSLWLRMGSLPHSYPLPPALQWPHCDFFQTLALCPSMSDQGTALGKEVFPVRSRYRW